jgi:hypothetical protein
MRPPKLATLASIALAAACTVSQQPPPQDAAAATQPDLSTPEGRIEEAMSAAPAAIGRAATIMDWPAEGSTEPTQLRAGTNGWTCFPSDPPSVAAGKSDPVCVDATSMEFLTAYSARTEPTVTKVGFMYMLQGDGGTSNTDPFATGPTPDNQWVATGPHIMLVVPHAADALADVPTDPAQGGPFVMWKGTPYAHVMMPVSR